MSEYRNALADEVRKREILKKIEDGKKKLNKADGIYIYYFLTGKSLGSPKVGRPKTKQRDMDFALEFMRKRSLPGWKGIERLADKHEVPYINGVRGAYNAFYRGRDLLGSTSKQKLIELSERRKTLEEDLCLFNSVKRNQERFDEVKAITKKGIDECNDSIKHHQNVLELIEKSNKSSD